MRRILFPLLIIGLAAGLFTLGSGAFFSDVENSTGNTFTAGTLDFACDGTGTKRFCTASGDYIVANTFPGDDGVADILTDVTNEGTIDGDLYVMFTFTPFACDDAPNGGVNDGSQYCDDGGAALGPEDITVTDNSTGLTLGTVSTLDDLPQTCATAVITGWATDASATLDLTDIQIDEGIGNDAQGDGIKIDVAWLFVPPGQHDEIDTNDDCVPD